VPWNIGSLGRWVSKMVGGGTWYVWSRFATCATRDMGWWTILPTLDSSTHDHLSELLIHSISIESGITTK
jgi:hypothetical protein